MYIFVVVSCGFDVVFSVLAKRLAGKSISDLTYIVSSGMCGGMVEVGTGWSGWSSAWPDGQCVCLC